MPRYEYDPNGTAYSDGRRDGYKAGFAAALALLRDERIAWQITANSDAWKYNPDAAAKLDQQAQAVWRTAKALADALAQKE